MISPDAIYFWETTYPAEVLSASLTLLLSLPLDLRERPTPAPTPTAIAMNNTTDNLLLSIAGGLQVSRSSLHGQDVQQSKQTELMPDMMDTKRAWGAGLSDSVVG
jgi:hypothetical protein